MENNFEGLVKELDNETLLFRVYQFDQWDAEMLQAIEHELELRGMLPNDIGSKKQQLIEAEDEILSEGKEATFPQQFLGWIGVLGVLGLIIGYNLAFSKTVSLYTGKAYYKYNETSRESGKYMFYISLTVIIVYTIYKLLNFMDAIL
jgi:hypothetical protein